VFKKIYSPLDDPKENASIRATCRVRSGWDRFLTVRDRAGATVGLAVDYMKYSCCRIQGWDYHTFDMAKDLPKVQSSWTREAVDSMNPDLRKFRDRGGQLILYQGWGDDTVSL